MESSMGATTSKLTFDEFQRLPEQEGRRYELDEGELLMEPSPTFQHNRIRDRVARRLHDFVATHRLGEVIIEMDFRLSSDTVRNPDIAFVSTGHLSKIDVDRSPVDGAPALAIEVISPANTAQDTVKKIRQYLQSGCRSVWIIYPALRLIEVHSTAGVRSIQEAEVLRDEPLLPGFSLELRSTFDDAK